MGRADFTYQKGISIESILLDPGNPRIRTANNQQDCIARVLRKEEQMLTLMKSIAKDGLTTMPILIYPCVEDDSKWIVKDGNRRITALKLLNNQELCPDEHLKKQIGLIRQKSLKNIPAAIDCLSSTNQAAIIQEVLSRHSGAMGGAGQLEWNSYLRTIYLLNNGHSAEYKRSGQYLFWAESHGIPVDDDFPITNVSRFFNTDNLELLGFKIEKDEITPTLSDDKVIRMASKVISDFGSGKVQVSHIFTPELAKNYLDQVRTDAGIFTVVNERPLPTSNNLSTGNGAPGTDQHSTPTNATQTPSNSDGITRPSSGPRSSSPTKPPWDRKKLFWAGSPSPAIPVNEVKARTIVAEIKQLNVQETSLAATMLLRGLIEISDNYYRELKKIQKKSSLAQNIGASADAMFQNNLLNKSQLELVKAYSTTDKSKVGILHIDTLQKYLHRETHHPNFQTLNTFWDEISCFVRACWHE